MVDAQYESYEHAINEPACIEPSDQGRIFRKFNGSEEKTGHWKHESYNNEKNNDLNSEEINILSLSPSFYKTVIKHLNASVVLFLSSISQGRIKTYDITI